MRMLIVAVACSSLLVACDRAQEPDAYGNVEAVSVTVGAEASGRLLSVEASEGQSLSQGQVVATIDGADLTLERDQLSAQRDAIAARTAEVDRQVDVLAAQRAALDAQRKATAAERAAIEVRRDVARRSYDRISILFGQQAATVQQRDEAERELRTADEQIRALDEQITSLERQMDAQTAQIAAARAQRVTVLRQVASAAAQVARASERLGRTEVRNPQAGTVLTVYARTGEVVQVGQPLYSIANLARVDVRAYVAQDQLADVRIGQTVTVSFDHGGSRQTIDGTVTWVSSQAEFTPTPIQTREERTDLVYAIKMSVDNQSGLLKIGMPVDVSFRRVAP